MHYVFGQKLEIAEKITGTLLDIIISLILNENQMSIRYNHALCYIQLQKPKLAIENCNTILEKATK